MGTHCSVQKRKNQLPEPAAVPSVLPVRQPTLIELITEKYVKTIELIGDLSNLNDETRESVNQLIMIRALIVLEKRIKPNNQLMKAALLIRKLEADLEFQQYFPILSTSLYEQGNEIRRHVRDNSFKSTDLSVFAHSSQNC